MLLLDEKYAHYAFESLNCENGDENCLEGERGEVCKDKRRGNNCDPSVARIKEKRFQHSAAGAESKVGGVRKSVKG